MTCRSAVMAFAALFLSGAAMAQLPNYDAVADAPRLETAARAHSTLATSTAARLQWDDRFGVPSFFWPAAKQSGTVAAARLSSSAESLARAYVSEYAELYGVAAADVADAYVADVHDIGRGAIVVTMRQRIGGIEVFREQMSVVLGRDQQLVAMSGHLSALPRKSGFSTMSSAPAFLLSAAAATRSATADATSNESVDIDTFRFVGNGDGGFMLYDNGAADPVRAKRVYFHLPDRFEAAYYVEMYVGGDDSTSNQLYGYVISALDGRVLFRNSMSADQTAPLTFGYRVWATETGDHLPLPGPQGYDGTPNPTATLDGYQPKFIAPSMVNVAFGPISTKDPWLANDAAETVGNNADAYVDLTAPDGMNGNDFRASTNAPLMFDRIYDTMKTPVSSRDQQMAAITQLFYNVNFMHDWYYDAGFNEAAGNAQANNFGRGGIANDSMRAEAQDYGGRNNANMSTPSDGGRPRMQMYVFDNAGNRTLRADAPSSIAKAYLTGFANFGEQAFDVSGDVVTTTPIDGCAAITNNVSGKIAFIDRGGVSCTFALKAQNAKTAGALAVIVGNVLGSPNTETVGTMGCPSTPCTAAELALPPSLLLAFSDATAFRSAIPGGGVRVTMRRESSVDRDGTIDNEIVAHEWMHYMSNRLISDGNGLVNQQGRGMGEGWSDFNAMILIVRPDDTRFSSNATFGGAYGTAVYVTTGGSNGPNANNGTYYGIRRVPYSTDLSKNPLTLKHVQNGIPITGASLRSGADGGNNAEVHNTGEVWATMLWEAYAAMLRDTLGASPRLTFAEAQQRMKEYLVASLKITPPSPTILEARDAVLAAAFARDKVDYQEFWQAFAKRGAGFTAAPPERYSVSNTGAGEDFNGSGGMAVLNVAFDDNVTSCLKNGILDGGETGAMRISLKNIGGARLQATTVNVSSADASVSFDNGGATAVPASNPGDTVVATVLATLATSSAIVKPDITITINDPQITTTGGMKSTYLARLNAFDAPKDTATDDVESATSPWITGAGNVRWTRLEVSPREHRWFAPEPWAASDLSLVSPPLMVATAGSFSFSFKHRFAFDYATSGTVFAIDGGVLEITTDDGRSWSDIGDRIDAATTGYGTTPIYAGNGSAIENKRAFISTSPRYSTDIPSSSPFTTTTVNLGTDYAGKRVKVRFRSVTGADHSTAPRNGWEIDDIAFTNIQNLPFATVSPDRGICSVSPTTTALTASVTTVTNGQPVTLTANVGGASPAGTVDFFDNGAVLATVRVDNGVARLTTGSLPTGMHTLTASFNGGKYYTASSSGSVSVQVGPTGRHRAVGK